MPFKQLFFFDFDPSEKPCIFVQFIRGKKLQVGTGSTGPSCRILSKPPNWFSLNYSWWKKSCTTKDDDYPIIFRVLTIPGGAGFRPSTVSQKIWISLDKSFVSFFVPASFEENLVNKMQSEKYHQGFNHTDPGSLEDNPKHGFVWYVFIESRKSFISGSFTLNFALESFKWW